MIVDTKMESEQFSSASVLVGMADLCRLFFVDGEQSEPEPDIDVENASEPESDDDDEFWTCDHIF